MKDVRHIETAEYTTPLILAMADDIPEGEGMPAGSCRIPGMAPGAALGEGSVMVVASVDEGGTVITNYVLFKNPKTEGLEECTLIDLKKADLDEDTGEYTDAEGNVYATLTEAGTVAFEDTVTSLMNENTGLVFADIYLDGEKITTKYYTGDDDEYMASRIVGSTAMFAGTKGDLTAATFEEDGGWQCAVFTVEDGNMSMETADHDVKIVFGARDPEWVQWNAGGGGE
ncbi:MAG: hypothetical protein IJH92_03040 [Mogibacterium sp.]|nr:hypothetical protein [Clostridia bacterium]MBR0307847.1 hypothetical protein [Mogibacterium sp.]